MKSEKIPVSVKQDPNAPVAKEVIASAIVKIADGILSIRETGLHEKDIITLIRKRTSASEQDIKNVLDGIEQLRRDYSSKRKT